VAKLWRLSQKLNSSLHLGRVLERMMDEVEALRFPP
jgi:hypothetical protein